MYAILLAAALTLINLNEYGMVIASVWLFTGLMCFKIDWVRNMMFGFYIVAGFWYFLAG